MKFKITNQFLYPAKSSLFSCVKQFLNSTFEKKSKPSNYLIALNQQALNATLDYVNHVSLFAFKAVNVSINLNVMFKKMRC